MFPFHPPRPGAAHPRPGDPGRPPFLPAPMPQQMNPAAAFQPPGPNAFNPMAAVAAANPFLAMQLFGQAQQLQNLANLAAAFQQQQQQQPQQHQQQQQPQQYQHQQQQQQQPFFPGGFPPNPNQFGAFQGMQAGFNGGGAFRPGSRPPLPMMGNGSGVGPGGAGFPGSRPPLSMMSSPAGSGFNGGGVGPGSLRPPLSVDGKVGNIDGRGSQVNNPNNKSDGISHVLSENGVRNNTTDQKTRFNPGTHGRDGRQFGPSGGRGRGDGRGGKQFSPSGGRGRGDARDGRQFGPSGGRGRGRNLNQGRGRGRNDRREGKPSFTNNDSPTSGGRHIDSPAVRKRPPIIYDKNEVKQWIHARKKNYPTRVNINKKLSQSQLDDQKKDEEAQMRRRELKKVVEKQKEMGLELCEIPPGYLSETEGQPKESKWRSQQRDSRFGNRGGRGNKRPRNNDRRDFQSKRHRECNPSHATVESREPTLLQKLYSSDIKRDRHRLLHTFKFMAQNNFFKDWPDKPLEFPSVTVNQIELDFDIDPEDLVDDDDDLPDAKTAKDSSLGLKEDGELQDLVSSDEEDGSNEDGEADEDDDEEEEEEAGSKEDGEADEDEDEEEEEEAGSKEEDEETDDEDNDEEIEDEDAESGQLDASEEEFSA